MSRYEKDFTSDIQADRVDTHRFGEKLRSLRESYAERIGADRPGAARGNMRLSAAGLIKCLDSHGYSISSGAFSEIENGESLPRDAKEFLAAIILCLELSPEEADDLTNQLGYDILRSKLGEDVAERAFRRKRP